MSDRFQSYVFGEPVVSDGHADLSRVATYLLAEGIIGAQMVDDSYCEGHVPGPRAASILVEDNDYWRSFDNKGVEVEAGRVVEVSTSFERVQCPRCRVSIDDVFEALGVINEALSSYHEGHGDDVECPKCGVRRQLLEWDCDHGLAVGQAIVRFWNWPKHIEGIDVLFETLSGMKCMKVWGKL